MNNNHKLSTISLLIFILFSACSTATPQPTQTPIPTETPLPTSTFTPLPTITTIPTNTPTIEPTIALGDIKFVQIGGYSFRPPVGYKLDIAGAQIGVSDYAGKLIVSIYGATSNPQNLIPDKIADQFISAVFRKGNGEYEKGTPYAITVDGIEGSAYDISGTLFGKPLRGQAAIIMPSKDQYLFGLGVANTEQNDNQWEIEGSKVFNALLNSVTFSITEQAGGSGACVISIDSTYGYTEANAIKVGGGDFDGPPREEAYLDNLRGPDGENITYERNGSFSFGDTILDDYEIMGLKKSVTLYIDEYSYTEPKAPVGFTCFSEFPLSAP